MSEPRRDYSDPAYGTSIELISAMSALNMEPQKLEKPLGIYLSETDLYVNHAMEHLYAAYDLNNKSSHYLNELTRKIEYVLAVYHQKECPLDRIGDFQGIEWIIEELTKLIKEYRSSRVGQDYCI